MCGIFGFANLTDDNISLKKLREVALDTEKRGTCAYGFAWMDKNGEYHSYKAKGPISKNLKKLDLLKKAVVAICHTRAATHGEPTNNKNNHPHKSGSGYFVHNGIVTNYVGLIKKHKLKTTTSCDSEVIGLLINKFQGKLINRVRHSIDKTWGSCAIAGLWAGKLILVKRGNPLQIASYKKQMWFSSLGNYLTGKKKVMQDCEARQYGFDTGKLVLEKSSLLNENEMYYYGYCRRPVRYSGGSYVHSIPVDQRSYANTVNTMSTRSGGFEDIDPFMDGRTSSMSVKDMVEWRETLRNKRSHRKQQKELMVLTEKQISEMTEEEWEIYCQTGQAPDDIVYPISMLNSDIPGYKEYAKSKDGQLFLPRPDRSFPVVDLNKARSNISKEGACMDRMGS